MVRHYDRLAALLSKATDRPPPPTVVYSLTVDDNSKKSPPPPSSETDEKAVIVVDVAVKSVQTSFNRWNDDNSNEKDAVNDDDDDDGGKRTGDCSVIDGRPADSTPNGGDDNGGDTCVDLKAKTKLRKLCLLLKTNVTELRTVFRKRCDLGYEYEEWERDQLNTGLQALEEDVLRLFDTLDNIVGYRNEIRAAVDTYTGHERRYRELRRLNKRAKLRTRTAAGGGSPDGNDYSVCALFRKYMIDSWYGRTSKKTRTGVADSGDGGTYVGETLKI